MYMRLYKCNIYYIGILFRDTHKKEKNIVGVNYCNILPENNLDV